LRVAKLRGKVGHRQIEELEGKIKQIPDIVQNTIEKNEEKAKTIAKKFKDKPVFFFLGRGISSATALEGRLKLMEISYTPAIAYPAGESKHLLYAGNRLSSGRKQTWSHQPHRTWFSRCLRMPQG